MPDAVRLREDEKVEIWWDRKVHTPDKRIQHNRPDVVIVDRERKQWTFVDFALPYDDNVASKERDKITAYQELAAEVGRMERVKVETVPIVVGALGVVTSGLVGWLKRLGIGDVVGGLQVSALASTAAILRKVLKADH